MVSLNLTSNPRGEQIWVIKPPDKRVHFLYNSYPENLHLLLPGQRSFGIGLWKAVLPSPRRAGLGLRQPGREAGWPPREASAPETSFPCRLPSLSVQKHNVFPSISSPELHLVAFTNVIELRREMSTAGWCKGPKGSLTEPAGNYCKRKDIIFILNVP